MEIFHGYFHCCCYTTSSEFCERELCPGRDNCCWYMPKIAEGADSSFLMLPVWCVKCPCRLGVCLPCCIGSLLSELTATMCCTYPFKTFCDLGWTSDLERYNNLGWIEYREQYGRLGCAACLERCTSKLLQDKQDKNPLLEGKPPSITVTNRTLHDKTRLQGMTLLQDTTRLQSKEFLITITKQTQEMDRLAIVTDQPGL